MLLRTQWCLVSILVTGLLSAVAGAAERPYTLDGELVQGGLVYGKAPPGSEVSQDGQALRVSDQGDFLLGFTRDAPATSALRVELPDGRVEQRSLQVATREYRIQRIDGLPKSKVTPRSPEDLARIRRDAVVVGKARKRDDDRQDFLGGFVWPVTGPISGVYGLSLIHISEPTRH